MLSAFLLIGLNTSCDELPVELEEESGSQVNTLNAVQELFKVVTISGQIKGLDAVALDFECGIEYSTDPGFSKDSTFRAKADVNYSDREYSIKLYDLESSRKYYYRAYYINQSLISYGKTKEFAFNWGTTYWQASDGFYYTFNDDYSVIHTDSIGQGTSLIWSIKDKELSIGNSLYSMTDYIIQSISTDKIELYKKSDTNKTIIVLTSIEKSQIPTYTTPPTPSTPKRTVLVYIAADNNLTNIALSNIYSMNSCIRNDENNNNLLVFVDRKDNKPALLHLHNGIADTVKVYPELDSADPATLSSVIEYVKDNYESESYGLVMWSHGTGWLPTSQLHSVAPNMKYVQSRDGNGQYDSNLESILSANTKAFGWEDRTRETPKYACMDLDELVEAIPDNMFDFILFDAAYMGCVEVVYALRHKTKQIISSCYEIVSYGFPYHIVTRDFLNGDLVKTCREFYNYYNSLTGWERMGGISLVNTEGLDSLASCFKKIMDVMSDSISKIDRSNIQCFDRFSNHVFYDLEDFVDKLGTRNDLLTEFRLQLEQCVPYKASTPYIFQGDPEEIKVNNYCGLSVYVPQAQYDSFGLNDDYRKTEWSINTNYPGYLFYEEFLYGSWTTSDYFTYVFHEDHTGSRTNAKGRALTFTWTLHGNELEMVFDKYEEGQSEIVTFKVYIVEELNEIRMEVYDENDLSQTIIVFTKKQ